MSRVPASCPGRSGNPKITSSRLAVLAVIDFQNRSIGKEKLERLCCLPTAPGWVAQALILREVIMNGLSWCRCNHLHQMIGQGKGKQKP